MPSLCITVQLKFTCGFTCCCINLAFQFEHLFFPFTICRCSIAVLASAVGSVVVWWIVCDYILPILLFCFDGFRTQQPSGSFGRQLLCKCFIPFLYKCSYFCCPVCFLRCMFFSLSILLAWLFCPFPKAFIGVAGSFELTWVVGGEGSLFTCSFQARDIKTSILC